MQHTMQNTQAEAGDTRRWQIKWGTREPLPVKDTVEVRAYGQLEVSVSNHQQLAVHLHAQDEELTETARARLKDMAVQAVQTAVDKQDALAFPDHEGACAPECVEQVTADASTGLRPQLADMGLELCSFVIEGTSHTTCIRPVSKRGERIASAAAPSGNNWD
jgi:membrane protease subunit (stomatin/prohibitin family)